MYNRLFFIFNKPAFYHQTKWKNDSHTRYLGRFEVSNGTTLFLDEIGELPLELQAKLLRVIQDGEFERLGSSHTIKVDTLIIAATNRNLEAEVRKGSFCENLWYRLNVLPITVPPLRDRLDDIPLLVDFFYVKKIAKWVGKTIEIIPAGVMNALQEGISGNWKTSSNVRLLTRRVPNCAWLMNSRNGFGISDQAQKPYKRSSRNISFGCLNRPSGK